MRSGAFGEYCGSKCGTLARTLDFTAYRGTSCWLSSKRLPSLRGTRTHLPEPPSNFRRHCGGGGGGGDLKQRASSATSQPSSRHRRRARLRGEPMLSLVAHAANIRAGPTTMTPTMTTRPLYTKLSRPALLLQRKAPGSDDIPADIYKHSGLQLMEYLTALSQEMWSQGEVPQDFKDTTIFHLYKQKGNRQICDNHRSISLPQNLCSPSLRPPQHLSGPETPAGKSVRLPPSLQNH
ncbi:hypothetical protein SprV_0501909000 [Sparganum proliferum]